MVTVRADALLELVTQLFERMGAGREDAALVARALVRSNLCGYDSHGVYRVAQYHTWWKDGLLHPEARPTVAAETRSLARVDGHWAFGQVVADFTARQAIRKAASDGVAVVTACRSNHVGRLADYAETIREAGLVGFLCVNDSGAGQCVVPWGAREPRLSTNPIAMAIPGREGPGILFDFSTAAAAMGKVRQHQLQGRPVPPGWLIDAQGNPTTDPDTLFTEPTGALLPAGGQRGYALSLAAEVLGGILSGAGCVSATPGPEELNGLFVLALDVSWFQPRERFGGQVDSLCAYVKTAQPVPGGEPVHIPGERSRSEETRRAQHGITLNDKTVEALRQVCGALGVSADGLEG
jgi:uncharacterized oxidoreductase